ncbi:MAG: glycosyltransferase family 8 protein [Neisseria sp.]|nr:glycosyltransferase family 8 protein [Neisseria sp.]
MTQTLAIAICLDKNYLQPAETLLKSLSYHNKNVKIYALHTDVPAEWFSQIQANIAPLANQIIAVHLHSDNPKVQAINARLASLDLPPVPALFGQFQSENDIRHDITQTAYYRLLLPELIDEHRLVYLDCDMLINGSIQSFNDVDLGDKVIAAIDDFAIKIQGDYGYLVQENDPIYQQFCRFKGGLFEEYFNSGVLLIDAKAWREQGICFDLLHFVKMRCNFRHHDQDILNFYFYKNWLPLSHFFNLQIEALWTNQILVEKPPVIIHFTGKHKPWLEQYVDLTDFHQYYHVYQQMTWEDVREKSATPNN